MSGIILLDKARGISSAQAISKLKKKIPEIKKIGHAGTLDPMATGLLVCLVNSTTKLAQYAEAGDKTYSGIIRLGSKTSTDDIEGEVIFESKAIPDFKKMEQCALSFLGETKQVPPRSCALKVNGERSYKLAREGSQHELAARTIKIDMFEVYPHDESAIAFRVKCSKGTYIRALARDLGDKLDCGAHLESLRREASLPFHVRDAKAIESLSVDDIIDARHLFPRAYVLKLAAKEAKELRDGNEETIAAISDRLGIILDDDKKKKKQALCTRCDTDESLSLFEHREGTWRLASNSF